MYNAIGSFLLGEGLTDQVPRSVWFRVIEPCPLASLLCKLLRETVLAGWASKSFKRVGVTSGLGLLFAGSSAGAEISAAGLAAN